MHRHILFLGLSAVALSAIHCEDAVAPTAVASVRITPAGATIAAGATATFTAEALDQAGAVLRGKTFVFAASNAGVATVANTEANPATFTGVAAGSTTITATSEGKTGSASLTVQTMADLQVTGLVIDGETRLPIPNATIEFVGSAGSPAQTQAGANGSFSFALRPSTTHLDVTARASGYVPAALGLIGPDVTYPHLHLEAIPLVRNTGMTGGISGTARNALDNDPIAGAEMMLFQGLGRRALMAVAFARELVDAGGNFSFEGLPAGTYTIFAYHADYNGAFRTGIAVGDGNVTPNQDVAMVPSDNSIRIVLTWGSSPNDLDSHLTGPNPSDASRFHVYYDNRLDSNVDPFAGLDLDDTNGSGPETITIRRLNSGNYRYSVHDYSNRSSASSTALGSSGAKVELYHHGISTSFFVPNEPGTLWTVFELSGSLENPTVTPRGTMGLAEMPADIPKAVSAGIGATDAEVIRAATASSKR